MRPLAAMPTRVSGVGADGSVALAMPKPAAVRSLRAFFGGILGVFAGGAQSRVTAGHQGLHERGRDGEGGRALGGVEHAETTAGAGADVKEAATLDEAGGDLVHRRGDGGELGGDRRSDGRVLLVDDGEHFQGGKLVDMFGTRVARFSCEGT